MSERFWRKPLVSELALLLVLKLALIFTIRAMFFSEPVISSRIDADTAAEQMSRHLGGSLPAVPSSPAQTGKPVTDSAFSTSTASTMEAPHDQ